MSFDGRTLYNMLPAIYRIRDAADGEPLKALLSAIAEQVEGLEEDLAQLYDDQFIETCAEWAVPYIGDLVGYRQVHGVAKQARTPRADVANAIRLRRRKGTSAILRELAEGVTGWKAHVVEFFQTLATTQYLNHVRPDNLASPDLRRWRPLERLDGPFDSASHTVDVRRIGGGRGRHNVCSVGIYLWRLRSYSLLASPAFKLDDRRYLSSPLGNSAPLFDRAQGASELERASGIGFPMPISRRSFDANKAAYYGPDKSFIVDGVPIADVIVCDLSDATAGAWAHSPPAGKVAIDPLLGRIAFGTVPARAPVVTCYYGFSGDLGGGEYERTSSFDLTLQPVVKTPTPNASVQQSLNAVAATGGVAEIGNSGRYAETPSITVTTAAKRVELRAANETRPVLTMAGAMRISGAEGAEVSLNGLLITGGPLQVVATADGKRIRRLRLSHCTLVPGIGLNADGAPRQPDTASLIVETAGTIVELDRCIIGGMRVTPGTQVFITDSILDATREDAVAYAAPDNVSGGAPLHIESSTVIGKVHAAALELASNCIFLARGSQGDSWAGPVWADRRQEGCVRFSYLPLESRTPRRYRCQPHDPQDVAQHRPIFTSQRYGHAGYCQLSHLTHPDLRQGAEDGAEVGAFHHLRQSEREIDLRVRLDEYLRFGKEAGLIFVN